VASLHVRDDPRVVLGGRLRALVLAEFRERELLFRGESCFTELAWEKRVVSLIVMFKVENYLFFSRILGDVVMDWTIFNILTNIFFVLRHFLSPKMGVGIFFK